MVLLVFSGLVCLILVWFVLFIAFRFMNLSYYMVVVGLFGGFVCCLFGWFGGWWDLGFDVCFCLV